MSTDSDVIRDALVSLSREDGPNEMGKHLLACFRNPSDVRLLGYWRTFNHLREAGTFADSLGKTLGRGYILWEQKVGVTFTWEGHSLRVSEVFDRHFMSNFVMIEDKEGVPDFWSSELEHMPKGWTDFHLESFDGQGSVGYLDNGDEIYPVDSFRADDDQCQEVVAWGSRSGRVTSVTLQVADLPEITLHPSSIPDQSATMGLKRLITSMDE